MARREKEPEYPFWIPRDVGDGMTAVRVPGFVYIKPCNGKYKYAEGWGSYVTDDSRFGPGSIVTMFRDINTGEVVKEIIMHAPPETVHFATETDKADFSLQRKKEENEDFRAKYDYTDSFGNFHPGTLDSIAVYDSYPSDEESDDGNEETYTDDVLIGELSDNPKIRNAQIRFMCKVIVEAEKKVLTDKNRIVFTKIFYCCMKEVDIADEMNVGKSAIANHKKRIVTGMAEVFRNMGFVVPDAKQLKAEAKAAKEREKRIDKAYKAERELERERTMIRAMTELFYSNGYMDETIRKDIEDDLDEAA